MTDLQSSLKITPEFLTQFGNALRAYPDARFGDALSRGQIRSKLWLIEELRKLDMNLGLIYIVGGWLGILPALMFEGGLKFSAIRSFDIDDESTRVAEMINKQHLMKDWNFKATTKDMLQINYGCHNYSTLRGNGEAVDLVEVPNTIINTSCEHLADFDSWIRKIPYLRLLALQGNSNPTLNGHKTHFQSLDHFVALTKVKDIFYAGEIDISGYKRFMVIGKK